MQLVGHLTEKPEVPGLTLGPAIYFKNLWKLIIFTKVIFLIPLIQEGQLSVTGESIGT